MGRYLKGDHSRETLKTRLLLRRRIDVLTGCWLWTGCKGQKGYGKIKIGHTWEPKVMRVAGFAFHGWPIKGGFVCNKRACLHSCFNPDHLLWFDTVNQGGLYLRERRWGKKKNKPRKIVVETNRKLSMAMVFEVTSLMNRGVTSNVKIRKVLLDKYGAAIEDVALAKVMVEYGCGQDIPDDVGRHYQNLEEREIHQDGEEDGETW